MSNLTKLSAPAPTVIMPMSNMADKLSGDPYAAIRNKDGSETLVSPNATIGEALDNSPHPWRKPTKGDIAEQDRMLREAKGDVNARHEVETNDVLDMMRKKQPGVRTGGLIGIRR